MSNPRQSSPNSRRLLPLGYSPYESLAERPHVMVDGAPRRSSVLTLSHWPQSSTPVLFARDLSVEIALEFVRYAAGHTSASSSRDRQVVLSALAAAHGAEAVTNDHFDEDGLMSVLALVDPAFALEHEKILVSVAACGDFGVVDCDDAARIAFAIGPLATKEAGGGAGTSERYAAVLPQVRNLLENPGSYEELWRDEMAELEAGRAAVEQGHVAIEEDVGDLAVVRRMGETAAPGSSGALPVHAAAVHSLTAASRILAFDGGRCELYMRYEGWVRYVSRAVPLRPDLAPLAAELTALEPGSVCWEANPVGAIVARLRPGGEGVSELSPEVISGRVRAYLLEAPPAWDPFRPGSPYVTASGQATGPKARHRDRRRGAGKRPGKGRRGR